MADHPTARAAMVRDQLVRRGITDARVLAAMGTVPREAFVPAPATGRAYADSPLAIGAGQTISQPYIVALMLQAAGATTGDRMLEVGAGCGYAAAVASLVVGSVVAVEVVASLGEAAAERLADLRYDRVEVRIGDGRLGVPDRAPFDVVLVPAAATAVPPALTDQLAVGGRLVMPVGAPHEVQVLRRITRTAPDAWSTDDLTEVRFVPLVPG